MRSRENFIDKATLCGATSIRSRPDICLLLTEDMQWWEPA